MKRLLLMTAVIVISMAANAKSNVVVVSDVANYIDFQTLSKTDSLMTKTTVTSTTPYTLANGSILKGYSDGPGTEAECKWVLSDGCTKDLPTPAWNGVDSLYVGTMFRAPANVRIELGAFTTTADGKLVVYYQPNGDADRGVKITVEGEEVEGTCLTASGIKIDGIRPAYAGEITLPKGIYNSGDVVITMTGNTSNLFGVRIEQLLAEEDDTSYNLTVLDKPNVSGSDWSNQVSISMISEENYSISLYIKGTTEMILGKKYKYADMDEWSNINNNNTYQNSPLSDAAITWSQRDGYDRYEGFVSDTLGNTYKFLYQDGPIIPTDDTISVSFSRVGSFEYSRWDSCWKVSGYDNYGSSNPYSVYFALNIDNESCPAGHFTEADFAEPEYNHIYINKQGKPSKDYKMLTADIDITVSSDTIILKGYAYLEDGNVYDIEIFYSDPKPVYKKTLEIYNLAVDTSGIQWGGVNTQASNDEYELRISFWIPDDSTDYHGTYDYGQMYPSIYDKTDSTYIQLFSGSITITKGADGDEITGALLGWNNTEYTVDLRTKVPASVGIISTAPKKKAVKRFVNGKIIIEIEGKAYSLTGAEIE